MKNSRTNWTLIRWTLLTMVGLAAGIVTAVLLDRPIEAVVGMMLVTPILTFGAGAILGASQWLQLRSMIDHTKLWMLATCIGLGVGLRRNYLCAVGGGDFRGRYSASSFAHRLTD